jgi:hypothetical protein
MLYLLQNMGIANSGGEVVKSAALIEELHSLCTIHLLRR